jgi:histidyl-tRNA synthetase
VADIETGLVIHDLMCAIGMERFTIHLNNRQVLQGVLQKQSLADRSVPVLRAIDKLAKIGAAKVAEELRDVAGLNDEQTAAVLGLAGVEGSNDQILKTVETLVQGNDLGEEGLARLREIAVGIGAAGVPEQRLRLDVAIARGLDYYTGAIFETFLDELPTIGSVCSGGRYDNLAGLFTRQELPGIGASLGLDRLLAALEELGHLEKVRTPAPIFIPFFDAARRNDYLRLAAQLRARGWGVEFYPEPKKLGQQLKYADQRGFRAALIIGDREWQDRQCQVKDLTEMRSEQVPLDDSLQALEETLRRILVLCHS